MGVQPTAIRKLDLRRFLRVSLWSLFHIFAASILFLTSATTGVFSYGMGEGTGLSTDEQWILIVNAVYAYVYAASWLVFAIKGQLASFWPLGVVALFLSVMEAMAIKNSHSILLTTCNERSPGLLLAGTLLRFILDGIVIYPATTLIVAYALMRHMERQERKPSG